MLIFKLCLVLIFIWTNVTAGVAIYNHGWNLFAVVVSDLSSTTWNAQFDADLLSYIFMTGLWIAWRQKFKASAILLGIVGGALGNAFFALYLLFLCYQTDDDLAAILLGDWRQKNV